MRKDERVGEGGREIMPFSDADAGWSSCLTVARVETWAAAAAGWVVPSGSALRLRLRLRLRLWL